MAAGFTLIACHRHDVLGCLSASVLRLTHSASDGNEEVYEVVGELDVGVAAAAWLLVAAIIMQIGALLFDPRVAGGEEAMPMSPRVNKVLVSNTASVGAQFLVAIAAATAFSGSLFRPYRSKLS
jgi:hypothetical protein